jgi:hypothetical protein
MRFASSLILMALAAWGQQTTVQDTIVDPMGVPISGEARIYLAYASPMISGANITLGPLQRRVTITKGVFTVALEANTTITPPGTLYKVYFRGNSGASWDENWVVPVSATPVTLRSIRVVPSTLNPTSGSGTVTWAAIENIPSSFPPAPHLHDDAYVRLDGAYVNPAWLANVAWSKLLDVPATFPAAPHLHDDAYVRLDGAYVNPAWLANVGWSKLLDVPATFPPAPHTHSVAETGLTVVAPLSLDAGLLSCPSCVTGGGAVQFVDHETPVGIINGVSSTFLLGHTPTPPESLHLYRNGILQSAGVDFSLSGYTVTFFSVSIPQVDDLLKASYRY